MWPAGLRLANNMIPIAGAAWMVPLLCGPWLNWLAIFTIGGNFTWWRQWMETFSALLATCAGNSPVPGEFPAQRPVTRSFDVFFDLCLNKRLSKQWQGWWFETLSRPLWRHRNEYPLKDLSKDCVSLEAAWLLFRVLLWLWYMFVVSVAMLSKYLSNTKSMILLKHSIAWLRHRVRSNDETFTYV